MVYFSMSYDTCLDMVWTLFEWSIRPHNDLKILTKWHWWCPCAVLRVLLKRAAWSYRGRSQVHLVVLTSFHALFSDVSSLICPIYAHTSTNKVCDMFTVSRTDAAHHRGDANLERGMWPMYRFGSFGLILYWMSHFMKAWINARMFVGHSAA